MFLFIFINTFIIFIFGTKILLKSVSENLFAYSIPPSIIQTFRLAPENYSDSLFIHPPLYIMLCLLLKSTFGVSLPSASLVFHVLTASMIPLLTHQICTFMSVNKNAVDIDSISVLAVIIFCFCPIVSFATQKVWIDNAAVMTITLCAVFHLMCVNFCQQKFINLSTICTDVNSLITNNGNHVQTEQTDINHLMSPNFLSWLPYVLHFCSGLAFGGLALNTKISNLAILPFLVMTSILGCIDIPTLQKYYWSLNIRFSTFAWDFLCSKYCIYIAMHLTFFGFGIVCGHGPWVYIYRVNSIVNYCKIPSLPFFIFYFLY